MELDNLLKPYEEKAKEIGVVMTPVIIINDEIKYQGSVPTISQIPITKKIGGAPLSEIILRYIKFKMNRKIYSYTKEEK